MDTVVFLGTPQRSDHQFDWSDVAKNGTVINLYDKGDMVQKIGMGGRVLQGAINISIHQNIGPIKNHLNLDSVETWEKYVDPVLTKPKVTNEKK